MYEIRRIKPTEVPDALALAYRVFMQFEAPLCGLAGAETFKRDIIKNKVMNERYYSGMAPIYAAFDGNKMIGIVGMSNKFHINLVYTLGEYHHQGVARAIFNYLLEDQLKENPSLEQLTLNSTPYGKEFYTSVGFVNDGHQQEINGITFTPMVYKIRKE